MQISVSGQHMSIGESLTQHAKERLEQVVGKYFDHAISASVHFSKQSYLYICDILINNGTGRNVAVKSGAKCDEPYSSFDQALAKLEKQLRRYKSKLKDHQHAKTSDMEAHGVKYIINPQSFMDEHDDFIDNNPVTIAEKPILIHTMSVADAIMRMDLENLPALMFKNTSSGRMNVVYYRPDGNISWVDSKSE